MDAIENSRGYLHVTKKTLWCDVLNDRQGRYVLTLVVMDKILNRFNTSTIFLLKFTVIHTILMLRLS